MYVLAIVHLHNTQTGQRAVYHDKRAYPSEDAACTHWVDGECGCDCNRSLAIWKATHAGRPMPDNLLLPCKRGRKAVIQIEEIELLIVNEGAAAVAPAA